MPRIKSVILGLTVTDGCHGLSMTRLYDWNEGMILDIELWLPCYGFATSPGLQSFSDYPLQMQCYTSMLFVMIVLFYLLFYTCSGRDVRLITYMSA